MKLILFIFIHIKFAAICSDTVCIEKNGVDLPGFVGVPDLLKWWFDGVGVDECVIVLMLGATVVFVAAVWFVPFVLAIFSAFASASYQNIGEMIERIKQSMFKSNSKLKETFMPTWKNIPFSFPVLSVEYFWLRISPSCEQLNEPRPKKMTRNIDQLTCQFNVSLRNM